MVKTGTLTLQPFPQDAVFYQENREQTQRIWQSHCRGPGQGKTVEVGGTECLGRLSRGVAIFLKARG